VFAGGDDTRRVKSHGKVDDESVWCTHESARGVIAHKRWKRRTGHGEGAQNAETTRERQ
jgi:hypothetical protein